MIQVTFPKWHEDARRMKASGMSTAQVVSALADAGINVSESRVRFVTGSNWELQTGREKARLKAKDEELARAKKEGRLPDIKTVMIKAADDFSRQWQEKEMSDRQFDLYVPEGQPRDGRNRMKISCSHNGCAQSIVFVKTGVISPVHARNWFMDKGWYVGKTSSSDLCPDHYHHDAKPKKSGIETIPAPKPSIPVKELPVLAVMNEPVEAFTPPPQAFLDVIPKTDKRVIIAKLEEVYEDEARGYHRGWNDDRVAKDLGVDQEWVELVRASIFGPAFSEADAEERAIKQQIEDHYSSMVNLASNISEAFKSFGSLMNELDGLMSKYRKLTDD